MTTSQAQGDGLFSRVDDLHAIEADCWSLLSGAVHDRACGWRLPVLATASESTLRQRIVVLRSVDTENRQLFAHTDIRSAKVTAINDNPAVSWLFYDSTHQVQLQVTGTASVYTDSEHTQAFWEQEADSSLRSYLAPFAPGTICGKPETNLPPHARSAIPARSELEAGRSNFAVVSSTATTAEIVLLRRTGNIRAVFFYDGDKLISADWLAP